MSVAVKVMLLVDPENAVLEASQGASNTWS